jgi:hypothetical protein
MWCRLLLVLLLCQCEGILASAQNVGNLPLVGVLRLNTPENVEPIPTIFRNSLAALGQVDGRNIRIEFRLAAGHADRFPELAQRLVNEKASARRVEAVIIRSSPLLSGFRTDLCNLSLTHKLPAIGQFREMAEAGCTASYGVKLAEMHGLAAMFTDKMLRGGASRGHPGTTAHQI